MNKKILVIAAGTLALLGAAAGGVRLYMVRQQAQDVLPAFVDVPAGSRAPRREFLGLEVGVSNVADAELVATQAGAVCENSSFRALMEAKRQDTKEKMAEAEARGDDPDGVTGASLANYRSKKERNPQVRLACDKVPVSAFTDRARVPGDPLYWLLIFDSPAHAMRHTSVSRRIDMDLVNEEWQSAVDNMTKRFGAPSTLKAPEADIAKGAYYEAKWEFADLHAQVSAFKIGDKARFTERVEVPWPVRVSTPATPAAP